MAGLVTLMAQTNNVDIARGVRLPSGLALGPSDPSDLHQLGRLYFEAYDPGIASTSLGEAVADIEASFAGEYGEYWHEASPVVESDGQIVAAVMTVHSAPWDDTPDCPFIIELFAARDHRRTGLARLLMRRRMATIGDTGGSAVALRVADDNIPARALYGHLGFDTWIPQN